MVCYVMLCMYVCMLCVYVMNVCVVVMCVWMHSRYVHKVCMYVIVLVKVYALCYVSARARYGMLRYGMFVLYAWYAMIRYAMLLLCYGCNVRTHVRYARVYVFT